VGFFENVPVFITSENEKRVVGRFDSVDHIASTSDQRVALDSNHSCKDVLLFSGGNYCSGLWQIWRGRHYFANWILRKPSTYSSDNLVSRSLSYIAQLESSLYGPIGEYFQVRANDTEISPQLLFSGIPRKLDSIFGRNRSIFGGLGLRSSVLDHPIRLTTRSPYFSQLALNRVKGFLGIHDTKERNESDCKADRKRGLIVTVLVGGMDDPYIGLNVFLVFGLEGWAVIVLLDDKRNWKGWLIALGSLLCLVRLGVSLHGEDKDREREYRQHLEHNREIVPQKHLDSMQFLGYSNSRGLVMANVLNMDKKIAVIGALAEGSSIRSIERITGVHRDTIMRLGVKVGQGCTAMMDAKMRNLPCKRLEMDEIWGFVGKKDRNVKMGDSMEVGSVWTFCAIDADTKLVPAFKVGERNPATTQAFVQDVADRMAYRVQISTDGLKSYIGAIDKAFGAEVDYAQIIKVYGNETIDNRRYSPSGVTSSQKLIYTGNPNEDLISTSYVERLNATTRLHMRRLTRLTLAFSKKHENFVAAVGLHFAYYNFVKRHNTLRMTPAMAAGVESTQLSVGELLEAAA